uniref:T9SS type A sorting domain-containing protein n=1 Tax=Leyella stercorea TaxID=363265 RepID=UPI003FD70E9E
MFVSNGKVHVGGEYDRLQVYNLAGAQVENADLAKGVYIVKVTADGKQNTKKVLVK